MFFLYNAGLFGAVCSYGAL